MDRFFVAIIKWPAGDAVLGVHCTPAGRAHKNLRTASSYTILARIALPAVDHISRLLPRVLLIGMSLTGLLLIILLIVLITSLFPGTQGVYPSNLLTIILIVVLVLLIVGHL